MLVVAGQAHHEELQPAETTAAAQTSANQAPAKQDVDDGKARFTCCGFGGKKSGKK